MNLLVHGIKFVMKKYLLCFLFCISAFAQEKEPIANYQILFSPDDSVAEELIAMIGKEQKSIKAAVYCLMHRGIAKALTDAHQRGVNVEVIVDPYSVKSRVAVKKMHEANVPVFVWNPPMPAVKGKAKKKRRSLMHDKFCVFGDSQVWTGSFNFTLEASRSNRENVIILENKTVASRYLEEFERLKKEGCVKFQDFSKQQEVLK